MKRVIVLGALLLCAGCGGKQQEETPRTLSVEKVQVRVRLIEPVEGLDAALAAWAASQAVEVVTVQGDEGPTPSLVEIELEDLDALLAAQQLRAFPGSFPEQDSDFVAGESGWRADQLYALPWRVDVVALLAAKSAPEAPFASWRDLDAWLQENGPLVVPQGHLADALVPLVWSAGGAWADSLGQWEIATDPAREALAFLERLVTEDRCLGEDALAQALAAGEAGMTVGGLAAAARWGARPVAFPPVELDRGAATVWLRPRAWAIPAGGPDAKLAAELARHLATSPACLARLAPSHLPAYRKAPLDASVAGVSALLPQARLAPPLAAWDAVVASLEEAASATTARRRSPGAALDDAVQRVRAATVRSR